MNTYNLQKLRKKLQKHLDAERFLHTQGVQYTCAAFAMRYGYDLGKAQVAGLLHDCAKCLSDEKKIRICHENAIEISLAERQNPFLLHAKVGAFLAKKKYHIADEEILNAIRYHTTGRADMTLLEKITYIADFIEPHRKPLPNHFLIRQVSFQDLDEAMYLILKDVLSYLQVTSDKTDPTTQDAYDYYAALYQKKEMEKSL